MNATSTPPRASLDVACVDHPQHDMPCPHRDHKGDMTPEDIVAAAAAVKALIKPTRPTRPLLEETP